jgi:hypothetical protein
MQFLQSVIVQSKEDWKEETKHWEIVDLILVYTGLSGLHLVSMSGFSLQVRWKLHIQSRILDGLFMVIHCGKFLGVCLQRIN